MLSRAEIVCWLTSILMERSCEALRRPPSARAGEGRRKELSGANAQGADEPAILIMLNDLTDRRIAERALRSSQDRFAGFMDSATEEFCVLDTNFCILDINKTAIQRLIEANVGICSKDQLD